MPAWLIIGEAFIFGAVIGSFLNVVIYRFHTGRSLQGSSHCLSCGHDLAWYELFPLLSFLALQGRCRHCGSRIPARYFLVELLTGGLFALVIWQSAGIVEAAVSLALISVLIVGVVYDLYHFIIPDEISAAVAGLGLLLAANAALAAGSWAQAGEGLLSALLAASFFAFFWWYSDGRWMGLGDAKLAFGLALPLGLQGAFSLVIWSFWIGALIGLALIGLRRLPVHTRRSASQAMRVSMKSEIPFAPFLAVSFVIVYFFNADVLALIEAVISSSRL